MGLFKSDLIRSFALGFLIGTAGLAASFAFDTRTETGASAQPAHQQLAVR